jgi:DNA end-binding protein Ku
VKMPADMLNLAVHILESKKTHFDPDKFEDRYESALASLIEAKQAGKPLPKVSEERPSNVINLMDALRRSVQAEKGGQRDGEGRTVAARRPTRASSKKQSSNQRTRVKRAG